MNKIITIFVKQGTIHSAHMTGVLFVTAESLPVETAAYVAEAWKALYSAVRGWKRLPDKATINVEITPLGVRATYYEEGKPSVVFGECEKEWYEIMQLA